MDPSDLLTTFFWCLLAIPVSLLLHEHGHLLAGLLLGHRRTAIGLGDPRSFVFWAVRIGSVRYRLHQPLTWLTYAYYVFIAPGRMNSGWRAALLAASGPAANLLTAVACTPALVAAVSRLCQLDLTGLASPYATLGLVSLWLGLYNLIPMRRGPVETDGMVLWRFLRGKR